VVFYRKDIGPMCHEGRGQSLGALEIAHNRARFFLEKGIQSIDEGQSA
jgi:hypothetical protein